MNQSHPVVEVHVSATVLIGHPVELPDVLLITSKQKFEVVQSQQPVVIFRMRADPPERYVRSITMREETALHIYTHRRG